jgi:16S rRNA (guanine1207-N2)-methyltransferase
MYERMFELNGRMFVFTTSDGVFSKGNVDEGTKWLLTAALPQIKNGGIVADLGCGYGVLGVVIAALLPDTGCVMVDINESAVKLANINISRHKLADRAAAAVCDGLVEWNRHFDYVVTNPPFRAGKHVVNKFFADSLNALKSGGVLFAVLRKQQGAESYIKSIASLFDNCKVLLKRKGYVVIEAVRN